MRYANFENYQPMLALMWLAASDTNEPEQDGINTQTRKMVFAECVARINRQHNYDGYRANLTTGKREQYDDMQGDKPSCFSGMKRGIFQALIRHSALQSKTYILLIALEDAVKTFVRDFYQGYFAAKDRGILESHKSEPGEYVIEFETLPSIPNLSEQSIEGLTTSLKTKYPEMQVAGHASIEAYVMSSLNAEQTAGSHFLKFYQTHELGEMLDAAIASKSRASRRPN